VDKSYLISNEVIESFLKCKYKAYLKSNNTIGLKTEYELLEQELHHEYKTKFYNNIRVNSDIPILPIWNFREKAQVNMPTYVFDPRLQSKEFDIGFEALELSPNESSPTKLNYIPISISAKEEIAKPEKVLLTVKCLIITQLRKLSFEYGKIIYGRHLRSTKVHLSLYVKEAQKLLRDVTKTIKHDVAPRFYQNPYCKICEFYGACHSVLVEKDDLSLLGRLREKKILKHNDRGIFTVHQLSYTFRPQRKRKKPSSKVQPFSWELKALALREKKTYIQDIPQLSNDTIDVYIDFEGLPEEGFIYLIGILIVAGGTEKRYSLWADSIEEEGKIFEQLFAVLSKFDNSVIYHYGSYEIQSLKRMNKRFNKTYKHEIESIIEKAVNILSFISSTIYPPTYTNELKEIASFLGFQWSQSNSSGIQSIVWRKRWELTNDNIFKDKLIQYNLDDCIALKLTKNWIAGISTQIRQANANDIVTLSDVKEVKYDSYKWGAFKSHLTDFEEINKYAYFNYQRERVYLRTNTHVKKALKKKTKKRAFANAIDKVVQIFPEQCPYCQSKDIYRKHAYGRKIIDLKITHSGTKRWTIKYEGGLFSCRNCHKLFAPEKYKELPDGKYGHNLAAWAINHHLTYRVSVRKVGAILLESFGIRIPHERVSFFQARLAEEYKTTYERIKQELIHGKLLHVDETPIELNSSFSAYVWVFTNMDAVFYLFRSNREADFLKELLNEFKGVLVSDFYSGYDALPCPQQKCLIHLMRDLNSDLHMNQLNDEFKMIVIRVVAK
jgi:predicted RecB family nuclease